MAGDDIVGGASDAVGARLGDISIRHDHLGERVLLQHVEEILALCTGQIIEPVAILQIFELHFEDRIECRSEHATKGHLLFRKAANPKIDQVEARFHARPCPCAREIGNAVRRGTVAAHDERCRSRPLAGQRGLASNRSMCAIGRDEVDDGGRVLEIGGEINPVVVGLQECRSACRIQLCSGVVE
ncbi:hypothetical protein D3C86_1411360 [compost metagenome]